MCIQVCNSGAVESRALRTACDLAEQEAADIAGVSRKKLRSYERNPSRVRGRRERARLHRFYSVWLPHRLRRLEDERRLAEALQKLGEPQLDSVPPPPTDAD